MEGKVEKVLVNTQAQHKNSEHIELETEFKVQSHKKYSLNNLDDHKQIARFNQQNKENMEIDVKPKKKVFKNIEEKELYIQNYQQKIKTELCKNYQLKGQCKFGDKCCFAHGKQELRHKNQKNHENYKVKPCKKFFLYGYCSYGLRCQYLHSEIRQRPEFYTFFLNILKTKCQQNSYQNTALCTKMIKLEKLCLQFQKIFENNQQIDKPIQQNVQKRYKMFISLDYLSFRNCVGVKMRLFNFIAHQDQQVLKNLLEVENIYEYICKNYYNSLLTMQNKQNNEILKMSSIIHKELQHSHAQIEIQMQNQEVSQQNIKPLKAIHDYYLNTRKKKQEQMNRLVIERNKILGQYRFTKQDELYFDSNCHYLNKFQKMVYGDQLVQTINKVEISHYNDIEEKVEVLMVQKQQEIEQNTNFKKRLIEQNVKKEQQNLKLRKEIKEVNNQLDILEQAPQQFLQAEQLQIKKLKNLIEKQVVYQEHQSKVSGYQQQEIDQMVYELSQEKLKNQENQKYIDSQLTQIEELEQETRNKLLIQLDSENKIKRINLFNTLYGIIHFVKKRKKKVDLSYDYYLEKIEIQEDQDVMDKNVYLNMLNDFHQQHQDITSFSNLLLKEYKELSMMNSTLKHQFNSTNEYLKQRKIEAEQIEEEYDQYKGVSGTLQNQMDQTKDGFNINQTNNNNNEQNLKQMSLNSLRLFHKPGDINYQQLQIVQQSFLVIGFLALYGIIQKQSLFTNVLVQKQKVYQTFAKQELQYLHQKMVNFLGSRKYGIFYKEISNQSNNNNNFIPIQKQQAAAKTSQQLVQSKLLIDLKISQSNDINGNKSSDLKSELYKMEQKQENIKKFVQSLQKYDKEFSPYLIKTYNENRDMFLRRFQSKEQEANEYAKMLRDDLFIQIFVDNEQKKQLINNLNDNDNLLSQILQQGLQMKQKSQENLQLQMQQMFQMVKEIYLSLKSINQQVESKINIDKIMSKSQYNQNLTKNYLRQLKEINKTDEFGYTGGSKRRVIDTTIFGENNQTLIQDNEVSQKYQKTETNFDVQRNKTVKQIENKKEQKQDKQKVQKQQKYSLIARYNMFKHRNLVQTEKNQGMKEVLKTVTNQKLLEQKKHQDLNSIKHNYRNRITGQILNTPGAGYNIQRNSRLYSQSYMSERNDSLNSYYGDSKRKLLRNVGKSLIHNRDLEISIIPDSEENQNNKSMIIK